MIKQSDFGFQFLQGRLEIFLANFLNRPVLLDIHNKAVSWRCLGNNVEVYMIDVLERQPPVVLL
jgi:hypothetical protein